MSDDPGSSAPSRGASAAVAGSAGVVVGGGVSTALFVTLGIKDIIARPESAAYALTIFSYCALFVLVAALFSIKVPRPQRPYVLIGGATFLLVSVVGTGFIMAERLDRRPVDFRAYVDPSWVAEGKAWATEGAPKLRMVYRAGDAGLDAYAPLGSGALKVTRGETIGLRIEGIQDLVNKYERAAEDRQRETAVIEDYCQRGLYDLICRSSRNVTQAGGLK